MQVSNTGRKTFKAGRVVAFSDGVMAVAATLLVLDLKLPEGVTDAQLGGVLSGSLHNLWVYVLSFVVVGLLWMGHHEQFSHIGRVDGLLIWLNLLYLLTIGLIPFLTSLLADHGVRAPDVPLCQRAGADVALVGGHVVARQRRSRPHVKGHTRADPPRGLAWAASDRLGVRAVDWHWPRLGSDAGPVELAPVDTGCASSSGP